MITVEERGGSTDSFEELNNMTLLIESKSCNPLNGKKGFTNSLYELNLMALLTLDA